MPPSPSFSRKRRREIFKSGLKESNLLTDTYFNLANFPISEPNMDSDYLDFFLFMLSKRQRFASRTVHKMVLVVVEVRLQS